MTLPSITFSEPVKVDRDSGLLATAATILGITDTPNYQKLSVRLQLSGELALVKEITLFEGEAYEALGEWTYEFIAEAVKVFYESNPFPALVPAPIPEPPAKPARPEPPAPGRPQEPFKWPENPSIGDVCLGEYGHYWQFAQPRNADGTFLSDIPETPESESAPLWIPI